MVTTPNLRPARIIPEIFVPHNLSKYQLARIAALRRHGVPRCVWSRKIRFLNPEIDLIDTQDDILLYISAFGPRSQALTAEFGAGWIYSMRNPGQSVDQLQRMQQAWHDAGRAPEDLYAVAQGSGYVLAPGEAYDSPRAKAQAGPSAIMIMHDLVEADTHRPLGYRVPDDLQPLLDAYKELYADYELSAARYLQVHRWHFMSRLNRQGLDPEAPQSQLGKVVSS